MKISADVRGGLARTIDGKRKAMKSKPAGDGGFARLAWRLATGEEPELDVILDVLAVAGRTAMELEEAVDAEKVRLAREALAATLPERERIFREARVSVEALEAARDVAETEHEKLLAEAVLRLEAAEAAMVEAKVAAGVEVAS